MNTSVGQPGSGAVDVVLAPGEREVFSRRPSPWIIPLRHLHWHAAMAGVLVLAWLASRSFLSADMWGVVLGLWMLAVAIRVLWDTLDWFMRRYTLTDRRVIGASGVLRRRISDLPLEKLQYLEVLKSLRQRVVGVGTVAAGTTGIVVPEVLWSYVPGPELVAAEVRREMERRNASGVPQPPPAPIAGGSNVLVVGLAGGIGSGKSTVGKLLEERGCTVLDSDAAAKQILLRPAVREQLVEWWGSRILAADGTVDRRQVAAIVFQDAEQRRKLEALVHPLIKLERDQAIARVHGSGGGIVVVDAPLLFEAGVDKECDAVVWVEAPRPARLERVRSRGWNDAELARREAAQWPVEHKRARATIVLKNDADLPALEREVERLVRTLHGMRTSASR